MGYTTEFDGQFEVTPALKPEHIAYLNEFTNTRRMKRDAKVTEKLSDPIREAVELPIGTDGEFYVGSGENNPEYVASGESYKGQVNDESVLDYNRPPTTQPALWCQWVATEDGKHIEWDGGEKFHSYVEWLKYFIENFLTPWGYTLNGEVFWEGEESGDLGKIVVEDNDVVTQSGTVAYD